MDMIEKYKFGWIVINGVRYQHDVEVCSLSKDNASQEPLREVLEWQREASHIIDIASVKRAVSFEPEFIIIGTGAWGMAKVLPETRDFISRAGIKLEVAPTKKAIKYFNDYQSQNKNVIGLFHLTC